MIGELHYFVQKHNLEECCIERILQYAIIYRENKIASFLLDSYNIDLEYKINNDHKLLHYICYYDNLYILNKIITKNIDLDVVNMSNNTALTLSAKDGKENFVRILLESGANINHVNSSHNTIIHYVCYNDSMSLLNLCLKYNPNLNIRNIYGLTPLDLCISKYRNNLLNLLLQNDNLDVFKINYNNVLVHYGLLFNNTNMNKKIKNKMFYDLINKIKILDRIFINLELNIVKYILDFII